MSEFPREKYEKQISCLRGIIDELDHALHEAANGNPKKSARLENRMESCLERITSITDGVCSLLDSYSMTKSDEEFVAGDSSDEEPVVLSEDEEEEAQFTDSDEGEESSDSEFEASSDSEVDLPEIPDSDSADSPLTNEDQNPTDFAFQLD
jgi:hypothetical protein